MIQLEKHIFESNKNVFYYFFKLLFIFIYFISKDKKAF